METMMILKGIGFVLLGVGLFLLATYAVMRLWNWLVPSLFNGPRLRFVQALGLFFLARLLFAFGGFGGRGFGRDCYGRFGPRGYERHEYWQEKQREKRSTNAARLFDRPAQRATDKLQLS